MVFLFEFFLLALTINETPNSRAVRAPRQVLRLRLEQSEASSGSAILAVRALCTARATHSPRSEEELWAGIVTFHWCLVSRGQGESAGVVERKPPNRRTWGGSVPRVLAQPAPLARDIEPEAPGHTASALTTGPLGPSVELHTGWVGGWMGVEWGATRAALEGKGPQRRLEEVGGGWRRLEEVAKAVGGGYKCH